MELPWHRVINARGEISQRADSLFEDVQRQLLAGEDVVAEANGRIDLARFQWLP